MNDWLPASSLRVYRHHWLACWKALSIISLLLVLSIVGFRVYCPAAPILLVLALSVGVGVHLWCSWHTYTFTSDNRLVRRRGIFGCTTDIISLFGTITPYQIPLLGQWLDMGSVRLRIAGPDTHIRHLANFSSFCRQLVESAQQSSPSPHVQVIIQLPYERLPEEHQPRQLVPTGPRPILDLPPADPDDTPHAVL